jgi:hypothetical protein
MPVRLLTFLVATAMKGGDKIINLQLLQTLYEKKWVFARQPFL